MIDAETLSRALHIPRERAEHWAGYVGEAMEAFEIDTPQRQAAFLAQIAHESAFLTRWVENLNYLSAERIQGVFGKRRFPTRESALPYVRNPKALAEAVYGNRADLGNTEPGDGPRFIGRGLIQLTGRRNYQRASDGMEQPYVDEPELVAEEEHAAMVSAWWWADQSWRGVTLNEFADEGAIDCISGMVNRGNPDKIAEAADERRRIYRDCLDELTA